MKENTATWVSLHSFRKQKSKINDIEHSAENFKKPRARALYLLCTSEDPEFHVEAAGAQVSNDQPIVSVSGKV